MLTGFAWVALVYTVVIAWLDWQDAENIVSEQRVTVSDLDELAESDWPIQFVESGAGADATSGGLTRGSVALAMGGTHYPSSQQVWIATHVEKALYLQRYLKRYEIGFLHDKEHRRPFVIETLQGEHVLADQPMFNVWLVTAQKQVRFETAMSLDRVQKDTELRAVLRSTHQPRARAVPTLASLLIAVTFFLMAGKTFWRVGYWGAFCTLIMFLVPILTVSPLISKLNPTYAYPGIFLAFMISASICAVISARLRSVKPKLLSTRIVKALIVPTVSLLVGVLAAVLLSGIHTLLVQDVNWQNFSQALYGAVAKPAWVLLQIGIGPCLILTLASGLFEYTMDRKLLASTVAPK